MLIKIDHAKKKICPPGMLMLGAPGSPETYISQEPKEHHAYFVLVRYLDATEPTKPGAKGGPNKEANE